MLIINHFRISSQTYYHKNKIKNVNTGENIIANRKTIIVEKEGKARIFKLKGIQNSGVTDIYYV